jgi:adenine nucleotide transporter 17
VTESKEMEGFISLASKIVQQEGPAALFTGWSSQVAALAASNFVYFYQYNGLKAVWKKYQLTRGRPTDLSGNINSVCCTSTPSHNIPLAGANLLIATTAGIINVLVTTPLWVVSTRLSVRKWPVYN